MANYNFNLRQHKVTDKETPINLIVRWEGLRLTYSTGLKVKPKDWDSKTQTKIKLPKLKLLTNDSKNIAYQKEQQRRTEFNILLDAKKETAKKLFNNYVYSNNCQPSSIKELRTIFDGEFKSDKIVPIGVFSYFKEFKNGKTNLKTKQWYNNTYNALKDFDSNLEFKDFDLIFHQKFTQYLENKELGKNTVAKHIQNVKAFLNWATDNGLNKNLIFKSRAFKKETEKSDSIALSDDEVNEIFDLDLSDNPKLDRVRDLFIVATRTGLRFSDFNAIKIESVKDGFIHLNTVKTGTPIVVPIHKQVENIMNKYKGITVNSLPQPLSNQKFNEYIKDVCEKIDSFNEIELVYKTIGGKKQVIKIPRYKRISSHCGRRTFATINYENKVPMVSIMAITGHQTSVSFLKYVKTDSKKHAEILASYWK